MANKRPRLEKIVTPKGTARYPHLAEPDEFEGQLDFKTGLILDPSDDGVAEFMAAVEAACQKAYEEGKEELQAKIDSGELKGKELAKAKSSIKEVEVKLPWEEEFNDAGEETGRYIIKAKALAEGVYKNGPKKGQKWKRDLPIFDAARNEIKGEDKKNLRLWGGSVIRLQCEMQPYFATGLKLSGVSLRLYSVQVIELGGGASDAGDGFGVEDGYTAAQSAPAAEDFDDESAGSGSEEDDF